MSLMCRTALGVVRVVMPVLEREGVYGSIRMDFRGVSMVSIPEGVVGRFTEEVAPYFSNKADYGFPGFIRTPDVQLAKKVIGQEHKYNEDMRQLLSMVGNQLHGEPVFQLSGGEHILEAGGDPRVVVALYAGIFSFLGREIPEKDGGERVVDHIFPKPGDVNRSSVTTTVRQNFHTDIAGTGVPDETVTHNAIVSLVNPHDLPTLMMPVSNILEKMREAYGADAQTHITSLQKVEFYTPTVGFGAGVPYPIVSTALGFPEMFYVEDGFSRSFTLAGERALKALDHVVATMANDGEWQEVRQFPGGCSVISETKVLHAGKGLPDGVREKTDLGMDDRLLVRWRLSDPDLEGNTRFM